MLDEELLSRKLAHMLPLLNERQRRILLAAEAEALGRGGIAAVSRASGVSRPTIEKGLRELRNPSDLPGERSRRPGGGRKRLTVKDRQLRAALERLVDPHTRGDPMSPLRWTSKSTLQLADALTKKGHPVSHDVVADLLRELGYSLQAARKTREGSAHADRDAQFRYLNEQLRRHLRRGEPVLSVDTKKKELIGDFANKGREYQPKGQPEKVRVHDFLIAEKGKVVPYGVYDVKQNTGWVSVGVDSDTASFAVQTLRRWWSTIGSATYPKTRRLLICADAGGSNGYKVRLWKVELQRFATETGLHVTVCHFPPGTSKWNQIEHRLFAYISMNWRGRPLVSHEVVLELIGATTTRTGLKVHAELDPGSYPKGVKVTDEELASVRLEPHDFHGDWNYTIRPLHTGDI